VRERCGAGRRGLRSKVGVIEDMMAGGELRRDVVIVIGVNGAVPGCEKGE
jgi:hypothetical protein